MSWQAHLKRNYTSLGHTEHATDTGDGHATARRAADQTSDEGGAPGSGARVEAGTNTTSQPTGPPLGTALPWGRGHLDYARLEGDASCPSDHAEQAAAQDLGLWIDRLTTEEQLNLAVRIRWLLTSRSRHLAEGTRTMADMTFGHQDRAPAPRHHEAARPMALCGHPAHGAYVGLQPG